MTSEQFIKFREMIEREFSHAVTKHPKFCDLLVNNLSNWDRLEHMQKDVNSEPPFYGENILLEEVAEAFNAYSRGELEHSLQEFAQCGAVVMRCMFFVMEKKLEKENHSKNGETKD
jgi:hypothetical protein